MMYEQLDELFDELWPICRSITGPGIAKSLEIVSDRIPLEIKRVPTGTAVFDWVVPPEWELVSATLCTEDGEKVLSTDDCNLHVLNFSEPFSGVVSYDELAEHLYSDPSLPEAVPYVTSYYRRRWGFCLSESQKKELLRDINYRVEIITRIYDGFLRYGELFLQGDSDETVLLTTYLCHPSMANNELSGPLALVGLYNKLSELRSRHYSYRFLVWPETIGSISYLATTNERDLDAVVAGLVLTCLGGPSETVSFKHSRGDWVGEPARIDTLVRSVCRNDGQYYRERDFSPTGGSDERQLCSPGVNLPVIQAARTVYGDYDQYHTSLDTKDFMTIDSVVDSVEKVFLFLRAFELNRSNLVSAVRGGEPMLGKRGLYPTTNSPQSRRMSTDHTVDLREQLDLLLQVVSLVDGGRTVSEIADFLGVSYDALVPTVESLIDEGLLGFQ